MEEHFISLDKKDQLNEIIRRLYDFTTPANGMEDYIFFKKNDAIEHLNEAFGHIDLDATDETDNKEIYDQIKNEIENMQFFITFKSGQIERYIVDDYSQYADDLANQIIEIVQYTEMEMKEDF